MLPRYSISKFRAYFCTCASVYEFKEISYRGIPANLHIQFLCDKLHNKQSVRQQSYANFNALLGYVEH